MKRGCVGGRVKRQDLAELMSTKIKSKESEIKNMLKDKGKEKRTAKDDSEEESEEDNFFCYSELDSSDDEMKHEHGKEREVVDASKSESEMDSVDDESEEECGDMFHKLFDGQGYCMCLI